jgi:hypothetical protein
MSLFVMFFVGLLVGLFVLLSLLPLLSDRPDQDALVRLHE